MIYQVTDDSLLIVACMSILMTTQLRQSLKARKLSVVLLANFPSTIIKPQEANDRLCSQGRLEFLFNRNYFFLGIVWATQDERGQEIGYVLVQFFLDQCETIGREYEVMVSIHE